MTVYIKFNIDNDAYRSGEGYDTDAVAETIRGIADQMDAVCGTAGHLVLAMHQNIRDANGNIVGTWAIKDAGLL